MEYKERGSVPWGQVGGHYLCLQRHSQQAAQVGAGAAVSYTSALRKATCCLQVHSTLRVYIYNSRV